MKKKFALLVGLALVILVLAFVVFYPGFNRSNNAQAAPEVFASPVHAGCYIAAPSDCRIHVEPFTIDISSGAKLVYFQLIAIGSTGSQKVIYDFKPDVSNPVPAFGASYTPSLVTQDFAATCGKSYQISLQGQDTGDLNGFNLGLTGQFTCPASVP